MTSPIYTKPPVFHLDPLQLLEDIDGNAQADGNGNAEDAGSNEQPTPLPSNLFQPSFLTDSSMLAYCSSQLQGLDSQIQQMFSDQQKQNEEQQIINQALQVLQGNADGTLDKTTGKSAPNQGQCAAMEQALEKAIDQIAAIDPNAPCLDELKHIHDNLMATGTGPKANGVSQGYYFGAPTDANPTTDGNISGAEMGQFIQALQNVGSGLNSDAQLRMIQIQSLVSQQQTAVELTTNIMQSMNDATNKVVGNIH